MVDQNDSHESVVDAGRDPAHRSEEPGLSEPVPEHPGRVLGGFNWSSQHGLFAATLDAR